MTEEQYGVGFDGCNFETQVSTIGVVEVDCPDLRLIEEEQKFFEEYDGDCFVARDCFRAGFNVAYKENAELRAQLEMTTEVEPDAIDDFRLELITLRGDLQRSNNANIKLAYKNKELHAQLARCVDMLENISDDYHTWYSECDANCTKEMKNTEVGIDILLESLPKTAALDAEILRWADQYEKVVSKNGFSNVEYVSVSNGLKNAVSAREGG